MGRLQGITSPRWRKRTPAGASARPQVAGLSAWKRAQGAACPRRSPTLAQRRLGEPPGRGSSMQSDWHEDPRAGRLGEHDERNDPMTRPQMAPPHNGHMGPEAVAELRRLARSQPKSGREAMAKASAIRTLERMSRGRRRRRCRQCRRAGVRMTLGIRTTSLIGCSCTSIRRSFGATGRRRGVRVGCNGEDTAHSSVQSRTLFA
jgi:hypothetical protein